MLSHIYVCMLRVYVCMNMWNPESYNLSNSNLSPSRSLLASPSHVRISLSTVGTPAPTLSTHL